MLPAGGGPQTNGVETASGDATIIQSPNVGGQGRWRHSRAGRDDEDRAIAGSEPATQGNHDLRHDHTSGLVTEAGPPTKTMAPASTYKPLAERDVSSPPVSPQAGQQSAPAGRTAIAETRSGAPPATTEPTRTQTAAAAPVARPPAAAAAASTAFIWPVKGPILSSFGPTAKGQHNDGVNIAVPKGTPVLAAADGNVVYVGNELRGFGNLLLIKHAGTEYITAYANNDKLLVRKGDHVTKGQKVALSGDTGGVGQPQLHFELRQGAKAIDPQTVLPNELSPASSQAVRQDPG